MSDLLYEYAGLLIALAAALAAGLALRHSVRWHRRALPARGRVVDWVRRSNTRYPVIAFETQEGEAVRFNASTNMNAEFAVGDAAPVLYNPERPEDARIGKVRYVHSLGIILTFVAVAAAGVWIATRFYGG